MHTPSSAARNARPALVIAAVLTTSLIFPLSITGPAAALPHLTAEFDAAPLLPWIVTAYNAAFAAFLLLGGLLADWLGVHRIYAIGVCLFAAAAGALALGSTPELLVVARAIAGVGAAAATTGGTALLSNAAGPERRGRAFGALGTIMGAGLAFGPLLSSLVVGHLGWRGVFAVPAVLAAIALILLACAGSFQRAPRLPRPALGSALLFTGAFLALTVGVGEIPPRGLGDPLVATALGGALLLCVASATLGRAAASPLVPAALLHSRQFLALVTAAGALMAVFVPLVVFLPLALSERGAGEAAVATLALTVPTVVLPSVGARLARRISPTWLACLALGLAAVGLGTTAMSLGLHGNLTALATSLLAVGAAVGLTSGVLDGAALAAVPERVSASAAGVLNTARLASETIALAVAGALILGASVSPDVALAPVAGGLAGLALLALTGVVVLARAPGRG
ncbi:MFS transporter [Leucobacter komagatae]|uniref:MFS transporter n=1 Tax=Leucobacter komagatae TaxID=55969 RepID=UPI0005ABBF19|nr:MFS transporter [Leucobacter komagatae]